MILMKLKKLLNQALDYMISYFISWGILQATNEFIACMVKYFYDCDFVVLIIIRIKIRFKKEVSIYEL